MKLRQIALGAFVTGFSGAAMPGPVLAAAILLAVRDGFWAGPLIVLGHGLIEVGLVLAVCAGLHRYLTRPEAPLVRAIGLIGGAMLLVMAAMMLRDLPRLSLAADATGPTPYGPVAAGVIYTAANPYFWVWWATIGLGLLTEAISHRGRAGLTVMYTGHILSDLTWYSLVTFLLATGRRLLTDGVYRALIGACAAMLICFGGRFVVVSLRPPRPVDEQPGD